MKLPFQLAIICLLSFLGILSLFAKGQAYPLLQNELPSMQDGLFLPIVVLGAETATEPDGNLSPETEPDSFPLQVTAVPNQYVVIWKSEDANISASSLVTDDISPPQLELLDLTEAIDSGSEDAAADMLASYQNNPSVQAIEPNYLYTATFIPDDPRQNDQWAWGVTNSYDAWNTTLGDSNTIIAIVDTGIDLNHVDLQSKLVPGYDFVHDDGTPTDRNGHGTHVSGTAAASTNNSIGGAGACPNCAIMPLQALGADGRGSLNDIASAIIFATDNGADVINLSLGGTVFSTALLQAVNYAWEEGVFVTCAAGNEGTNERQYPAAYTNCMGVAATNEADSVGVFSSYGTWVDYAAPGVDILSTFPNDRYETFSGTSMAAPHVAGLAGLLDSQGLTNDEIKERICDSAEEIEGTGDLWVCGRIDVRSAVGATENISVTLTPVMTPTPDSTELPLPTPSPTGTVDSIPTKVPTAAATPTAPLLTSTPIAQPTITPTVGPTATPALGQEIIDGGFETGSGWTYSGDELRTTEQALSGDYSVRLSGNIFSPEEIMQNVVVPQNSLLAYSILHSATVEDWDGSEVILKIEGLDNTERTLILSHGGWGLEWQRFYIDMSQFANQPITIRFQVQPTFTATDFYIDDVAWQSLPE